MLIVVFNFGDFENIQLPSDLTLIQPSYSRFWGVVFFYVDIGFTLICPPMAFNTFIIVSNCGFAPADNAL